jgi:asparagine synthase (glutamine-hydrolysing)
MCGITGIVAFTGEGRKYIDHLPGATDRLKLRGPDGGGTFRKDNIGLGHRRLSIIDVTEGGSQPMHDDSGRYTIVFNGEIFNFPYLREALAAKGATFQSHSDTEVLLKLYIDEREKCLSKLNGFFAFAIYDQVEKSLFVARDRMGIKPLLIYQDEDKLIFASEMKALLNFGIPKELDYVSLQNYLQLNYIPGPASILKGVRKLVPGSYLFIKGNKIQEEKFYDIPYNKANGKAPAGDDYTKQQQKLVTLLDESVQRRLISDVPLGAFLSGGIDSSVIVALASRHTKHLNTFSIGYKDEPYFDETKYANLVAKRYNTNHTVFSLSNDDLYNDLFHVLDYLDEPFADSSALAVNILSRHTREKVTVALSGDGADEMFGGYNKHMGEFKARQKSMAAAAVKALHPVWEALPKSRNTPGGNIIRQLHRFSKGMRLSAKDRYWRWCSFADEDQASSLLSAKSRSKVNNAQYSQRRSETLRFIREDGDMNDVFYTDMHLVLQNDMLTKVDSMSMANSLEVRVPFLDYTVVDFAFNLPVAYKVDGKMKKKIVQDAFRDLLPAELYNRPKHGFEVPLLKWFRSSLRTLITDDLLKDEFIEAQGIFDVAEIRKLKQKLFSDNPEDVHARIWGLIVFQYWWKKYFL